MKICCPLKITQHTAINVYTTGNKSEYTPKCKCPNWAQSVNLFVWSPLFYSTALTLLGMEFTRTSQVATRVLFYSSMTTSRSWWMLETLRSSTFRLRM
ncbi:unnamed protein product, partial [Staurois parvus]